MRSNRYVRLMAFVLAASSATTMGEAAMAQNSDAPGAQIHSETPVVPGAGNVGQRQTRWDTARVAAPMTRIASRIENRVDNRLRTRIDRGYRGLNHPNSSFENATEQTRVEGKKSTR